MDDSESDSEWHDATQQLDDVFGGKRAVTSDTKAKAAPKQTSTTTSKPSAEPAKPAVKKINSLQDADLKSVAAMDSFVTLIARKVRNQKTVTCKRPGPKFLDALTDQLAPEKFSIQDWERFREKLKKQIAAKKLQALEEKKAQLLAEEEAEAARKKKEAEAAGETYIDDEDFYADMM